MKTHISIHEVVSIRVKTPNRLLDHGPGEWRDVEIETADGSVFQICAFSDGDGAEIEVEDQPSVPERHREAG